MASLLIGQAAVGIRAAPCHEATYYNWKKKYGGLGVPEFAALAAQVDEVLLAQPGPKMALLLLPEALQVEA